MTPITPQSRSRRQRRAVAVAILLVIVVAGAVVAASSSQIRATIADWGGPETASWPSPTFPPGANPSPFVAIAPDRESIFVVDVPDVGLPGRVLALAGMSGDVLASFEVGADPAVAVTKDRAHLFVASTYDSVHHLEMIETSTGRVIRHGPLPWRWSSTLPPVLRALVLSPDDRWLFALRVENVSLGNDRHSILAIDTESDDFSQHEWSTRDCVGAILIPGAAELSVVCPNTGLLLSKDVTSIGLSGKSREFAAGGTAGADRDATGSILAVGQGGRVAIVRPSDGGRCLDVTWPGHLAGRLVFNAMVLAHGSANEAIVGLGDPARRSIETITRVDARTGEERASTALPRPAWSIALGEAGERLYVVDRTGGFLILDASSLQVVRDIRLKGSPTIIVAAP